MIGTVARVLSLILLIYMLVGFAMSLFDAEPVTAAIFAGFFVGIMMMLQLDLLSTHLQQIRDELKRQGRGG